jgi:hypothetical protein
MIDGTLSACAQPIITSLGTLFSIAGYMRHPETIMNDIHLTKLNFSTFLLGTHFRKKNKSVIKTCPADIIDIIYGHILKNIKILEYELTESKKNYL